MTVHYKTEGFVFKKDDRLEADRVFSVFSKEFGRVEIVGKAIRKITSKLRFGIEIFSFSEIEFIQGRHRKTLTDAIKIEKFKNIAESPEKMQIAYGISDVLDNFVKGEEKDEHIFNLLNETFGRLNDSQYLIPNIQLVYYYFFWNLISVLGHMPELSNCADCSQKLNPDSLYFSHKEGGVICQTCADVKLDGVKIKSDVVKILRLILKKDWEILSKLKMEKSTQYSLSEISDNYYQYLSSTYVQKII